MIRVMKTNKTSLVVLSIAILIVIALFIDNYYLMGKVVNQQNDNTVSTTTNPETQSNKTKMLEFGMESEIANDGVVLINMKIKGLNHQQTSLKKLLSSNGKFKLVLKISELNCGTCVDFLLLKAKRFSEIKRIENKIILLGSYRDNKSLSILKNNIGFEFLTYNMNNFTDSLNLPIEKIGFPYCFITDGSIQVRHLFIPDKAEPEIANRYFEMIAKRYFDN